MKYCYLKHASKHNEPCLKSEKKIKHGLIDKKIFLPKYEDLSSVPNIGVKSQAWWCALVN